VTASEAWEDEQHPRDWVEVVRSFRDGHEEMWWALDVGPYGPEAPGGLSWLYYRSQEVARESHMVSGE
jgi:hypothetical protein